MMNDDYVDGQPEMTAEEEQPKVIAIGGGKGGVGKTMMSASIAVGLATLKRDVVVIDADLGGANLHTVMGIDKPHKTFLNFLNKEIDNLQDILIEYPYQENLKVICGAAGAMGVVNLPYYQKLKFIRLLKGLEADFIVLDLGAGTSFNVLDFFLAADIGVVLVNPDPLSIIEGYNFVKQVFFRKLIKSLKGFNGPLEVVKKYAGTETFKSDSASKELLQEISGMNSDAGAIMEKVLDEFQPRLILNMMRSPEDETHGLAVKVATEDLLNVDMEYLGGVHKDDTVQQALDKMMPFISYDPKCQAARDLSNIIISKILHAKRFQSMRDKHTLRKVREKWDFNRNEVICSVKCIYWDECEYQNGGYPCKLQHLMHLHGFQSD